jgi:hypothetical protein
MGCSAIDPRKSPLAPLFQRGVLLWDCEELKTRCKKFPLFQRGIKGDFSSILMAGRLSKQ